METPGNDAIDKIRAGGSLTEEDRMHLTYYIATMIRRVPRARKEAHEMMPEILSEVADDTMEWLRQSAEAGQMDDDTLKKKLAEADAAVEKFRVNAPVPVLKTINTPWPFQSMLVLIHSMYWRIFRYKGWSCFVTSDNPAYYFYGMGLKHEECELTFPICKEMLIHCSWQPLKEAGIAIAETSMVKQFNRRIASGADRFIFYHEEVPWIASVAKNKTSQLSRIRWE